MRVKKVKEYARRLERKGIKHFLAIYKNALAVIPSGTYKAMYYRC